MLICTWTAPRLQRRRVRWVEKGAGFAKETICPIYYEHLISKQIGEGVKLFTLQSTCSSQEKQITSLLRQDLVWCFKTTAY